MTFDWLDFIAPLDPWVIAMAFVLGVSLGLILYFGKRRISRPAIFWQLAGGLVFFVPLSLLRAFQGSAIWERFLATYILWCIFVTGMAIGSRWRR
jgi:hypothetical protein